ncbi:beta-galactosidase [Streptomyces sp. ME19-01-6]|uniref:beta-galactosidase n=1 Tax=Streptomyces sp. ME19-01-6 TaxID=3028686 RepID=UPI0029A536A6|nr:beta-galactosidase [Streptomyces sp. ME19-01-6]MDX3227902.1 beta-galactosidase [Streptomyces sp. ME19-01-6]
MNNRMDAFRARLGGFAFGGDYNPEQWDRAVWDEDLELMRRAGVNLVTLGVFAWASLEPEPGRFTFDWMDEVMDLLHAGGISVDLATPTMAPPVWLTHEHPEVLPVMEDGERFGFGNRLQFDPASPRYREHAARITTALAERYSHHPALAMWHISNEYGQPSYGEASALAFRGWLQRKYGSLDALNDAWYTRFWSQVYTSWDQINPPEVPRSWSNPTRRLDFKRFVSDVLLECFVMERDIVRSYRDDIPVLTNYMRFYKNADYWTWALEQDAVALDIYPNPGHDDARISAALNFDLMRSLRGEPWVLMEQAASSVSQWKVNNVKRPGHMRLGSYQAIAHGADSVLYFQWRASRGGHERFHSAMLPHSGTASRTWKEIEALGGELPRIAEAVGARSRAEVAVLFDWNAWWGLTETHGLPRNDFDYTQLATDHYQPLLEAHHAVDMVHFGSDLSPYKVVVVPNAYLVDDRFTDAVTRFVEEGGTLVCSFFSGVVDANNHVRQPAYPGAFRGLIGAYIDEYWPARGDETFAVTFADGTTRTSDWWQDSIHPETARVLATYASGHLEGRPAILDNAVGRGRVVYLGTRLEPTALRDTLLDAVAAAGVSPLVDSAPGHLEAARRVGGDAEFLFLLNHSETEPAQVRLAADGLDLISGAKTGATLEVAPLGVSVVRFEHTERVQE